MAQVQHYCTHTHTLISPMIHYTCTPCLRECKLWMKKIGNAMAVLRTHHISLLFSFLSVLASHCLPSHCQLHSAWACYLNERSGPPRGGIRGDHITPKNVEGLQKSHETLGWGRTGGTERGEIGEHMKECIREGEGEIDWAVRWGEGWREVEVGERKGRMG